MRTIIANLLADASDVPPDTDSSEMTPYILLAGGFLIIIVVMLRNLRRRVAKSREHDRLSVAERVALTKPARDTHSQISELMAELAGLSRQINAQLDTRLARLEILLAQADQAIAGLSGEPSPPPPEKPQCPSSLAENTTSQHPAAGPPTEKPANLTALERDILDMAQRGMTVTQISQELGRPSGEIQLILALKQRRDTN